MVRIKNRWLLVRLDFDESFQLNRENKTGEAPSRPTRHPGGSTLGNLIYAFPSKREIFFALHDNHIQNFGMAASGEAQDIQVRFADPTTRLVLLRAPRSDYPKVRCTLTLMNILDRRRVVVSILSVNGSARTAKRTAIDQIRRIYRQRLTISLSKDEVNVECARLEDSLSALHAIEF